jgi:hypothetical protein
MWAHRSRSQRWSAIESFIDGNGLFNDIDHARSLILEHKLSGVCIAPGQRRKSCSPSLRNLPYLLDGRFETDFSSPGPLQLT